jgi:acetoin utilization protein AcuB
MGRCVVRGEVPPGCPELEERLVCARFECRKGEPAHSGNDCLMCDHYRGWRDGPGPSHVSVTCGWSSDSPVWQRMTHAPALVTVPPELTVAEAIERASDAEVHHVLVTADEQLLGVMCRCDLSARRFDERVSACVALEVYAIESSATLGEAAGAMASLGIGCLPVLEKGRLVGVITHSDLFSIGGPPKIDSSPDYGEGD